MINLSQFNNEIAQEGLLLFIVERKKYTKLCGRLRMIAGFTSRFSSGISVSFLNSEFSFENL